MADMSAGNVELFACSYPITTVRDLLFQAAPRPLQLSDTFAVLPEERDVWWTERQRIQHVLHRADWGEQAPAKCANMPIDC